MDELSEKIYDAVLAFVEDVDNGKLSMAEAEDCAIGYISTELSEYVEQPQETPPYETVVILRKYLVDEIERIDEVLEDEDSELYRGMRTGLGKALNLLDMRNVT